MQEVIQVSNELTTVPTEIEEAVAEAEADRLATGASTGLAEWYIQRMTEIEETRRRIREMARSMDAALERRRKGLIWKFGAEFKEEIDERLRSQGGRKKSVTLLTGRAGYRATKGKIVVQDRKALAEWCASNCTEALEIVVARTSPIREHIEANGEIPPGVEYVGPGDVFYPPINLAALPTAGEEESDE